MTENEGSGEGEAAEAAEAGAMGVPGADVPGADSPDAAQAEAAEADAALEAAALAQAAGDDADGLSSAEYSTAFTPRNLAVGLAIVAGLVAFAASRRRRARRKDG